MTARHTQHWHGTRSVAGLVDAGGCCAGEAGWGAGRALSARVSDYSAGVDPTPADDTNGPQNGAQRFEETR